MEAEAGVSPTVSFSMKGDTSLSNITHVLTKDGGDVHRKFRVEGNTIIFRNARVPDSGTYTITCIKDEEGVLAEDTVELYITPKTRSQFSHRELIWCS